MFEQSYSLFEYELKTYIQNLTNGVQALFEMYF